MSKNAIHVVGLRTAPWLAVRSALNGYGNFSWITVGGIDFLGFFAHAVYAAGVLMSDFPSLSLEMRQSVMYGASPSRIHGLH